MTAIAYALAVLQAIPQLLTAGADVVSFVKKHVDIVKSFGNNAPTKEQWDALNTEIAADRYRLHSDTD